MGDLHADGGGQAVAHGAEAARGHPAVRVLEAEELGGPHLVLAHFGGDVAVHALGQGFQPLQGVLRLDGLFAVLEGQTVHRPPFGDLLPPLVQTALVGLGPAGTPLAQTERPPRKGPMLRHFTDLKTEL